MEYDSQNSVGSVALTTRRDMLAGSAAMLAQLSGIGAAAAVPNQKVIVDCDPGWDDCLVLLLLLAKDNSANVVGITSVWGNEDVQATTTNARRMTYYLGWSDIPIYVGAMQPFKPNSVALPCPPSSVVRELPPLGTVVNGTYAPEMLVDMAKKHGPDLTILGIGSMTNIAAAAQTDTAAMKRVGTLVITGGSFKDYQTHEFNLGCDPVATQTLLDADLNPVIITFDTEMTMNRGAQAQEKMRKAGQAGNKFAGFYAKVIDDQLDQNNKEANEGVFDQLAALYALDPSVFTLKQTTIVLDDIPSGRIEEKPSGRPARIATVNVDRAYDLLFSRLNIAG